jgi:DNA-binding NarL/FixJ family response regulator
MIAPIQSPHVDPAHPLEPAEFLKLLAPIERQAARAVRNQRAEARAEFIQAVVANAYCAWVRLVQQGRAAGTFSTPLARYAIRQVRAGRRVGGRQHASDVLSGRAARLPGGSVQRLDRPDPDGQIYCQLLIEDRRAGPAETAMARLDFLSWLRALSPRQRQIARALAVGEPTSSVAEQFGLSPARISQFRGWFHRNWEQFQNGAKPGCAVSV